MTRRARRMAGVILGAFFVVGAAGCPNPPEGADADGSDVRSDAADADASADTAPRDSGEPADTTGDVERDGTETGSREDSGVDADGGERDGDAADTDRSELPRVACDFKGKSTGVCRDSYLERDGDCHRPEAYESEEVSCDGLDNDCDGAVDAGCPCAYLGKGTGVCSNATIDGATGQCEKPEDYEKDESSCDNKDNDCDGTVDEAGEPTTYYYDPDGDGYGNGSKTTLACSRPSGWASRAGDCDNSDASVHPGAPERCGDGRDTDCDGKSDRSDGDADDWCRNNVSYADACGRGYDYQSNQYETCCFSRSSYRNYCQN